MTPQPTLEEFGERPFSFYPPLLGVEHNESLNVHGGPLISNTSSRVATYVIPTNEELMIAQHVRRLLHP